MDKAELPFLSASELSRLIESREVSPVEVTDAYLAGLARHFGGCLATLDRGLAALHPQTTELIAT